MKKNILNLDNISFGVAAWLMAGGVVMGTIAAFGEKPAQVVAHTEQGDFTVTAPSPAIASTLAAEATLAGVPVEFVNPSTFYIKVPADKWAWWTWFRLNRLTDCIVVAGASGRGMVSAGAEG